jgi:hypothetical protein
MERQDTGMLRLPQVRHGPPALGSSGPLATLDRSSHRSSVMRIHRFLGAATLQFCIPWLENQTRGEVYWGRRV